MTQIQDVTRAVPITTPDEYESQFQAWWRDFRDDWRQRYPSVEPPPQDKARAAFAAAWARHYGQRRRPVGRRAPRVAEPPPRTPSGAGMARWSR
jgi:hypothetical protein